MMKKYYVIILAVLLVIYINTVIKDAKGYSQMDPLPERKD